MGSCFVSILFIAGAIFVLASLIKWFEQTAEALDHGEWNRVALLIVFPFGVWFFPSRVAAGRPTAVPFHEPVRGFGKIPSASAESPPMPSDQPPPGTPPEFIGLPKIPQKKPQAPIDPEKLARLRQKMREQGMLDE